MHSIIFINTKEQGRENDRTAEMDNMVKFCSDIADALGYKHNLLTRSDREFTRVTMDKDISSLNVEEGDIVVFYFDGHGRNKDMNEWPHMDLQDKEYWLSIAYSRLKRYCIKAKLTLCIASCCNLCYEGDMAENAIVKRTSMNPEKVKKLFTGFEGNMSIIMSSCKAGQNSWSFTRGSKLGSLFSICLRETIREAMSRTGSSLLTWEAVLERAKFKTKYYNEKRQEPQYLIEYH